MTPMERIERELQEARQRIEELERHNVGLANESCAQQEQIAGLKSALTRQAKAAKQGMDAAKAAAYTMEQNASRMYAECSPEALESERKANAQLTEQIAKLEREVEIRATAEEVQIALRERVQEERDALAAHVERLNKAALDAIHHLPGGKIKAELRDAYDSTPDTSLAHFILIKQAEALETLYNDCLGHGGDGMIRVGIMLDRAIELKEEAEEQQ